VANQTGDFRVLVLRFSVPPRRQGQTWAWDHHGSIGAQLLASRLTQPYDTGRDTAERSPETCTSSRPWRSPPVQCQANLKSSAAKLWIAVFFKVIELR
jgi:hypothetical protein